MKPELAIPCGLQASGKSTYARRYLASTHAYVSKDRMRDVRRKGERQAEMISRNL